jgi:hypothetical protein
MECPNCHLINPDTALRCDCGYDFRSGRVTGADDCLPPAPLATPYIEKREPTLGQRFGTSCAWAVAIGVLSGLVIAVVLFVVGYFTAQGLERAMIWTMITMLSACIAAVAGGILGFIVSFWILPWRRRKAAERGRS